MSVWGENLDGRTWNDSRGTSMSVTAPPADYRWHHSKTNIGQGNDEVYSEYRTETMAKYREIRLAWLDQFDLEIAEEGKYRVWRWLGKKTNRPSGYMSSNGARRLVKWEERRPIDAPLPKTPGLWPSDE